MIRRVFNYIRGVFCLILVMLNMLVHGTLTLIFGFLVWPIPHNFPFQKYAQRGVLLIPTSWSQFNYWILQLSVFGKWDIQGDMTLSRREWYMLISNHQSWTDILVIGAIFCRTIPPLKFFMKKELLWTLPVAGLCCYFLGYPLMQRHTRADIRKNPALKGQDVETAKKACEKFKELPTTAINFVEGTRFTAAKHSQQVSPFKHLLKPKAGGVAIVVNEMHKELSGVLNVTINYNTDDLSMFNILCGNVSRISVHYELLPVTDDILGDYYTDRQYRSRFQQWLNGIWERKDALLERLKENTPSL